MQEYEELLERFNPRYDRSMKQAETLVGPTGGSASAALHTLFEPAGPALTHPNPTPRCTAYTVVALTSTLSYVRNALNAEQHEHLECELRDLVHAHFGEDTTFDFPWVTKAFWYRPRVAT